jgi:hypothetical protein
MDAERIAFLTEEQLQLCPLPPLAIPEVLQREEFRFVKLLMWDKKAFEQGWTTTTNYTYDSESLKSWMAKGGNYGIATGHGGLLIVDIDDETRLRELGVLDILDNQYPSKKVRTRSGGLHYYYLCHDFDKKRIMYDLVQTEKVVGAGGKELTVYRHLGEMQWLGAQCVGPSSRFRLIEPDAVRIQLWKEENALPIREVTAAEILGVFAGKTGYNKKVGTPAKEKKTPTTATVAKPEEKATRPVKPGEWAWVDKIRIEDIAMPDPIESDHRDTSGEIRGTHPLHGSESGANFSINVQKNVWHCFRCHEKEEGGGVLELLAVMMGLIECGEARKGCLKGHRHAIYEELRRRGYEVPPSACELKEGNIGLREHVDLVISRLAWDNTIDPQLFIYRGKLARVLEDGTIEEITRDGLPEIIDRAVRFYYMTGSKEPHRVNTYPPRELVGAILARGQWPGLPELKGVSKAPIVRKDFSICSTPGFDTETGIYYVGKRIELPAKVSLSMALGAALKLDKSLFSGFNFKNDASHSNAWALIMIGLLRSLFKKVPAFAISKPDVASGASTLSTMPAYIMQGNEGALLGKQRKSDAGTEETRKQIDTVLLAGEHFVIADNETSMEDDYYNTLITGDEITLRPLGTSKRVRVKNDYMLIFNGKHLVFTDDTARRIVLIELEPNNTKSFNFDLNEELLLHREDVLYHMLLIIKAWEQAGGYVPLDEDSKEIKKAGAQLVSFREAIKVIDSILQFVDVVDAFTNADDARNESNPDREMWESCFVQWAYVLHDEKIASENLPEELRKLERYLPPKLLDAVIRNDSGKIGYILRTHKDRPYGDGLVLRNKKIDKMRYWWIEIPQLVFNEYCPEMPNPTIGHRRETLSIKLSSEEKTPA